MKLWSLFLVLLPFCCEVICVPTSTASTAEDGSKDSSEVGIPDNMNIADYYFSIFGKHLDYDYREPILTFDEPVQNELSEESDISQSLDVTNRQKRFIFVPTSYVNATRRWNQQVRRLRMERRRLRLQRRRQWQQNRINYLNRRSQNLQRQAARLQQVTQRQQVAAAAALSTRSVPAQPSNIQKTTVTTAKPTTSSISTSGQESSSNAPKQDSLILAASNPIPVKQVPVPTNS
ncbi:unnamed protein product [Orchesella dallaii]|uniref:Uncharacterized protein n=1 Tax=Orchesella dallaii TaxID=48710 RepID=A0ABP1QAI1_9HEXA